MCTLPQPHLYNPSTSHHLLPSIARLHAACITTDHTLATFLPPLSHDKILASWDEWNAQVEAGTRVIAVQLTSDPDSNEVAGVASLFMPEIETGRHRSEVGRLLVSPGFRKRGLARGLMRVLEDVAREKGRWMVVCSWIVFLENIEFDADDVLSRRSTRPSARELSMFIPKWGTKK
jgi:GNAT superfamily N-acetyltransferase